MKKLTILLAIGVSACSHTLVSPSVSIDVSAELHQWQVASIDATFDATGAPVRCRIKARSEACAKEAEYICHIPYPVTRRAHFCK